MQTCFPVSNIFTWYISSLITTVNTVTVSPIRLTPCHKFHGKRAVNITLAFHLTPMAEPSATNKEKASPIKVSKAKTVPQLHFQYLKILTSFIYFFGFSQLAFVMMSFRFGISCQLMTCEAQAW